MPVPEAPRGLFVFPPAASPPAASPSVASPPGDSPPAVPLSVARPCSCPSRGSKAARFPGGDEGGDLIRKEDDRSGGAQLRWDAEMLPGGDVPGPWD